MCDKIHNVQGGREGEDLWMTRGMMVIAQQLAIGKFSKDKHAETVFKVRIQQNTV